MKNRVGIERPDAEARRFCIAEAARPVLYKDLGKCFPKTPQAGIGMDFGTALKNGCYALNLKGTTKDAIIREMVDLLVAGGRIDAAHADEVLKAIFEREKKMSTGVQHGVAIPHGKSDMVEELVTAVAVKREGVDFGSLDGEPSRIFVMTISSVLRTGPHLQYLAEISKLLNVPSIRESMLAANTVDELVAILTGRAKATPGRPAAASDDKGAEP